MFGSSIWFYWLMCQFLYYYYVVFAIIFLWYNWKLSIFLFPTVYLLFRIILIILLFSVSIWNWKLFFENLWRTVLKWWQGLSWICLLFWVLFLFFCSDKHPEQKSCSRRMGSLGLYFHIGFITKESLDWNSGREGF